MANCSFTAIFFLLIPQDDMAKLHKVHSLLSEYLCWWGFVALSTFRDGSSDKHPYLSASRELGTFTPEVAPSLTWRTPSAVLTERRFHTWRRRKAPSVQQEHPCGGRATAEKHLVNSRRAGLEGGGLYGSVSVISWAWEKVLELLKSIMGIKKS